MNIIIAIPCLKKGGTEMQTLQLVKALVNAGHDVITLCYFESDETVVHDFEKAGSRVALLELNRAISPWRFIQRLRNEFKTLRPDVVHVQYMAPGALPIIAARMAGIHNILATVHQPCTQAHGQLAKFLLRFSALLCARFITVSKKAEYSWFGSSQLYDKTKPLRQQPKHFTIYNAVDVEQIRSIYDSTNQELLRPFVPEDKLIIGAVSRLRSEKGIDILIKAFSLALKTNPALHLLIVGSGPDEVMLKQMAFDYGIADSCTFYGEAGWTEAMAQMSRMDMVVVPSRFEGFGLTAAEAMAMGKPVIASDVFGLSEVIGSEQCGRLFELQDYQSLSVIMLNLLADDQLRMSMGAAAQERAKKLFDFSVFKTFIQSLYSNFEK